MLQQLEDLIFSPESSSLFLLLSSSPSSSVVSPQDYVLVVPEASYSSSSLNEEPLDKSYDFISNCGQNSFFIKSVSEQQRKLAVELNMCFSVTVSTGSLCDGTNLSSSCFHKK